MNQRNWSIRKVQTMPLLHYRRFAWNEQIIFCATNVDRRKKIRMAGAPARALQIEICISCRVEPLQMPTALLDIALFGRSSFQCTGTEYCYVQGALIAQEKTSDHDRQEGRQPHELFRQR